MRLRLGKINCAWSSSLAYAVGLIATDGKLSSDGRHISYTTKDLQLAETYKRALNITNKIGRKSRGGELEKKYLVVQFGDVIFYEFLLAIGLTPHKSKTLGIIKVSARYFFDFLRGCIDGDGSIGTNRHPESQHLQLKVRLVSGSYQFLEWIKITTEKRGLRCSISKSKSVWVLSYGKDSSVKLLKKMYNRHADGLFLQRKYESAKPFMRV
jgi:hypothetical protein